MKKRINISLDEYVLEMLDEISKKRGIDRSAMISFMIYEEYNRILIYDCYGDDLEI